MAVTRLSLWGGVRSVSPGVDAAAVAIVSGTLLASAGEASVQDGGKTIVITLSNEQWVAAGATFDAARQAIIDGLDSDGAEGTGWNAEIRDKEVVGAVERTSPTRVTITLSANASYDIASNETVTVTVPATAVLGAAPITAAPTFTIRPQSALAHLGTGKRHNDLTLRHSDSTLRHEDNTLEHHS